MGERGARADREVSVPVQTVATAKRGVIHATWVGGHRFDTGRPGGTTARLDGEGETGQSPPDALLSALATCSAVDLVDIMAKRRTPVESLQVVVHADRRETMPRRFERVEIEFVVAGAGIERVHAERAVQLAFEKYCTVAASLRAGTVVETTVTLNGERGASVGQPVG